MRTRDRILDAAAHVMATRGLSRATTKAIAREVGLSEPMLYKHFANKSDLFLAVLTERLPPVSLLADGPARHLAMPSLELSVEALCADLLRFYLASFPLAVSVFSDADLLTQHRESLAARGRGPHRVSAAVAAYLESERVAGRCRADPQAAAMLLVGACFHRAFLASFAAGTVDEAEIATFAAHTAGVLTPGLRHG